MRITKRPRPHQRAATLRGQGGTLPNMSNNPINIEIDVAKFEPLINRVVETALAQKNGHGDTTEPLALCRSKTARMLGISELTDELIREKQIPHILVGDKEQEPIFPLDGLRQWLNLQAGINPNGEPRKWNSPTEVASLLQKKPYTVREWCRLGRINARKRATGRGDGFEWEISAAELDRYRNHGLLPVPTKR